MTDQQEPDDRSPGTATPGDTNAPDIVGRTGEEMPEVAHDNGPDHLEDEHDDSSDY